MLVDQIWLEGKVSLTAEQDHAEARHHRAQMLLRQCAAERAGRGAGDECRLSDPRIFAPGPCAPIDRVLENGGNGAVVLRRDDQHAVGARDLVFEARHFRRQIAFVVLVVHWQIIDAGEDRLEFAGAKPDGPLGRACS